MNGTPRSTKARLWKDGHGIERLPLSVKVGGLDVDAVVVRTHDLLALESVLEAAANIVACCSEGGIHWDNPDDRADFFARADAVWLDMLSVWRGADEAFEDDDAQRPQ